MWRNTLDIGEVILVPSPLSLISLRRRELIPAQIAGAYLFPCPTP